MGGTLYNLMCHAEREERERAERAKREEELREYQERVKKLEEVERKKRQRELEIEERERRREEERRLGDDSLSRKVSKPPVIQAATHTPLIPTLSNLLTNSLSLVPSKTKIIPPFSRSSAVLLAATSDHNHSSYLSFSPLLYFNHFDHSGCIVAGGQSTIQGLRK